jgi:hypothetical protein
LRAPYAYPHNIEQLNGITCQVSFVEIDSVTYGNFFSKKTVDSKIIGPNASSMIEIRCTAENIKRILDLAKFYTIDESDGKNVLKKELKQGLGLDVNVDISTHDVESGKVYEIESWCFNDWQLREATDF